MYTYATKHTHSQQTSKHCTWFQISFILIGQLCFVTWQFGRNVTCRCFVANEGVHCSAGKATKQPLFSVKLPLPQDSALCYTGSPKMGSFKKEKKEEEDGKTLVWLYLQCFSLNLFFKPQEQCLQCWRRLPYCKNAAHSTKHRSIPKNAPGLWQWFYTY